MKGRAHYLLGLNDALKRSVTSRWLRDRKGIYTGNGVLLAVIALQDPEREPGAFPAHSPAPARGAGLAA